MYTGITRTILRQNIKQLVYKHLEDNGIKIPSVDL